MKKKTVSQLRKALWKIFAIFIKQRDQWKCFTCDRYATGYGMGAGHYIAKGACGADAYFSEINVNAQCTYCNLTLEGNRHEYRKRLVMKYGEEPILALEKNYRTPNPFFPYLDKMAYYKGLLANL